MQYHSWFTALEPHPSFAWSFVCKSTWSAIFTDANDNISWKFGKSGRFSVKSCYDAMTTNDSGMYHKRIWKSAVPAKIKIFLWLMYNNAVLTKDNMIKRKWTGDLTCYFCDKVENLSHLFFQCSTAKVVWAIVAKCIGASNVPRSFEQCWNWCDVWMPTGKQFHTFGIAAVCWAIWKARNRTCFEGKPISNLVSIICHVCSLMKYWAGLFKEVDKEALENGVNTMLKIATSLLAKRNREEDMLIKDNDADNQEE